MHIPVGGNVRSNLTFRALFAVLLLAMASAAGAAGLGKLVVLSAMGEPFKAEIDLLSHQDEWAALQPRLALPADYKLADFRYSPALAGAQLQIRKHPNGRNYIAVSTTRRVNEPYVSLLVELDLNGARLVRAYTALLDPYGYGAGLPRVSAVAERSTFLPVIPPAVTTSRTQTRTQTTVAASKPSAVSAAVQAPQSVPAQAPAAAAQSLQHLETQIETNTKSLSAMLARVAVMEEQVRQLQRQLAMQDATGGQPAAPTPAPAAVSTTANVSAPVATSPPAPQMASPIAELPPRRKRSLMDTYLNEALLVLAGGALLLLGGLVYWMSNRPRLKE